MEDDGTVSITITLSQTSSVEFQVTINALNVSAIGNSLLLLLLLVEVTYNQVQPLRINRLLDHLVSTQITIIGLNCFIFIITLIVPSTKIV